MHSDNHTIHFSLQNTSNLTEAAKDVSTVLNLKLLLFTQISAQLCLQLDFLCGSACIL